MEKLIFGILGILILFILGFVFIYAPTKAKSLEKRAADFMIEFKPQAEAIDANFIIRTGSSMGSNGIMWMKAQQMAE